MPPLQIFPFFDPYRHRVKGCLLQGYDKLTHPQLNCKFIPYQYETIFLLSFEYFLEERFPIIELFPWSDNYDIVMIIFWLRQHFRSTFYQVLDLSNKIGMMHFVICKMILLISTILQLPCWYFYHWFNISPILLVEVSSKLFNSPPQFSINSIESLMSDIFEICIMNLFFAKWYFLAKLSLYSKNCFNIIEQKKRKLNQEMQ